MRYLFVYRIYNSIFYLFYILLCSHPLLLIFLRLGEATLHYVFRDVFYFYTRSLLLCNKGKKYKIFFKKSYEFYYFYHAKISNSFSPFVWQGPLKLLSPKRLLSVWKSHLVLNFKFKYQSWFFLSKRNKNNANFCNVLIGCLSAKNEDLCVSVYLKFVYPS